jgi:hypothetical protein
MFGLQAVNRHSEMKIAQVLPSGRYRANRTRHELYLDAQRGQPGKQNIQFAAADQRLASDDREV